MTRNWLKSTSFTGLAPQQSNK